MRRDESSDHQPTVQKILDRYKLNELQLYSASSFLPRNLFTGGISGEFRLGIEPHYDDSLERKLAGNIGGGLGATFEPIEHLSIFAMANVGVGYGDDSGYVYAGPEIGFIIDEALGLKTVLTIKETFGQLNDEYTSINLHQSMRINPTYTVAIDGTYFVNDTTSELEFGAMLKYLF